MEDIEEIVTNTNGIKGGFCNQLKSNKSEDDKLQNVQILYENNEIGLNELSDEDLYELKQLYKKQIEDIKNELEKKKNEFIVFRDKLRSTSK